MYSCYPLAWWGQNGVGVDGRAGPCMGGGDVDDVVGGVGKLHGYLDW